MPSSPQGSKQTLDAYPDKDWLSLTGEELAQAAMSRWSQFRLDMDKSFYFVRGQLTFVEAMGLQGKGYSHDDSQMGSSGEQAQLITVRSNKVQQLARRQLAMIVQTRPAFAPIPTNSSYKARSACTFAKKLLNYELDRRHLARHLIQTGEAAQYWAEGHLFTEWDFKAGKALDGSTPGLMPDPMLPSRSNVGAPRYWVATLEDVAYDLGTHDAKHPWMIVRTWARKWDLIATYCAPEPAPEAPVPPAPTGDPMADAAAGQAHQDALGQHAQALDAHGQAEDEKAKLADRIRGLTAQGAAEDDQPYSWNSLQWQRRQWKSKSDMAPVYNLVAHKSAALPQGLQAQFLANDIFLWQGPLPISRVPVVSILPSRLLGSPFGDSLCQHLAALQRIRNQLMSALTSNLLASANPPLVYDPNDNATPSHMQGLAAMAVTRNKDGQLPKPEIVDLSPRNTKELVGFIEMLDAEMSAIMSVSQTLQGDPQQNVRSGNFGALIVANDLAYSNDFADSFATAIAEQGDLLLEMYKAFGDKQMEAEIAGPGNTFQVVQFTADDLSDVASISVQKGNPAARSPSFQLSMLQTLLQAPNSTIHVNDIVQFLVSGSYDSLLDDDNDEALCIEEENEMLLKGQQVPVMLTDRAWIHVPKHTKACASPEIRQDPAAMQAFLAHIQQHLELDQQMPPNVRLILGGPQAPLLPPPAPPPPPTITEPLTALKVTVPNPAAAQAGAAQPPPGKAPQGHAPPPRNGSGHPTLPQPAKTPSHP